MEWYPFLPHEFEAVHRESGEARARDRDDGVEASNRGSWGVEEPTAIDVWLLECVYEVTAADTTCSRCGAPLGPRVKVDVWPTLRRPLLWRVRVKARCRGWRRHSQVADVAQRSEDVILGTFRVGKR